MIELGLADTSVFIAKESGRGLGVLPSRLALSVVTLGELELGLLNASDASTRAIRAQTLEFARAFDPLAITESVMSEWARLVVECRAGGIRRAVRLTDSLIAATAVVHGIPVVTQDRDFDQIARIYPRLQVVQV